MGQRRDWGGRQTLPNACARHRGGQTGQALPAFPAPLLKLEERPRLPERQLRVRDQEGGAAAGSPSRMWPSTA